jgi:hypothetical protein
MDALIERGIVAARDDPERVWQHSPRYVPTVDVNAHGSDGF